MLGSPAWMAEAWPLKACDRRFQPVGHMVKSLWRWLFFYIDNLATHPEPQVLVISQRMGGTEFLHAMNFSLLQYLLRVIRAYCMFFGRNRGFRNYC
ncbi:hypothetical protein AB3S75_048143 [Citrus x aurantiifolia]